MLPYKEVRISRMNHMFYWVTVEIHDDHCLLRRTDPHDDFMKNP